MAITAATRNDIIELVVVALNEAPGTTLLNELVAIVDAGGSLADVADALTSSDSWKAKYPAFQTAEEFADEWLGNLVPEASAAALAEGKSVAVGLVNGGASFSDIILAAQSFLSATAESDAAFGTSVANFNNKTEVATYYTITQEVAAAGTDTLSNVDSSEASVTAAKAAVDTAAAPAGSTIALTTALDTGASFVGGAGNDTFSSVSTTAAKTTIGAGDTIDGGAGTDRLTISVASDTATATSAAVASTSVEEVAVYNNSGAAYSVDTSLMAGLTDLYVVGGNAAADVTFTGVKSSPNVHLTSIINDVTVTNAASVGLGSADAVTIALTGAIPSGTATLTYNDIETFNVVTAGSTTGSATRSLTLTSDQLETVNVSGASGANITATMTGAAILGQVGTLDASEMTGALRATVAPGASGLLSVTGGSGGDTLTMGAMSADYTVDGGAGADTLVVTSAAYSKTSTTGQVGDGVTNMEVLAVSGSADLRAFSNNTFASLVSAGSASITGLGTDAASLTMLAAGSNTLDRATDGAADEATVTFAGTTEFTVASLNVADEETLTINSASTVTGGVANTITSLVGTDLTSLTLAGSRDLTISAISGTKLATVDASGLSGTGTVLNITASSSTADMTVTGAAGVESSTGEVMNTITTGTGDDTITTGDYADTISAGNGDNTIVAGDGDNTVTTGRGTDTVTAGDGDNTITTGLGADTITAGNGDNSITAGSGDDTVTVGGTTTSTTVFDSNTIDLGAGDDTLTSGDGKDTVTLGSGDDNASTGGGADKIYMSDFDDDDVIDGGAGSDLLSAAALATLTTTQVQAVDKFIDVTPGTSRSSTPQFTAVETVYMDVNLAAANASSATTSETVSFASSSGISNLYLNVTDGDATNAAKLTLSSVDASAIHLIDSGTTDDLGTLVVAGAGQASLTLKGHDFDGSTAITVSDADALTVTEYVSTSVSTVGASVYGTLTANDSSALTVTLPGVASTVGTSAMTVGAITANSLETLTLSAGSNATLTASTIATSGDELTSIDIDVAEDGTMNLTSITATAGDVDASTMTIDVGVGGTFDNGGAAPVVISADSIAAATVTVGAAATLRADLTYAGATTVTASAGSTVDIDDIGVAGLVSSVTISGRATLAGDLDLLGEATLNFSGLTAAAVTIDGNSAGDKTIVGNNSANTLTTGAGDDSVTGGGDVDTIDTGAGDDSISAGAGADDITGGTGADVINGGTGADTYSVGDTDSVVDTGTATSATAAGIDTVTVTDGDIFDLSGRTEALNANDGGAAVSVTLTDNTDDTTATELLAAIDAAIDATAAADDVFLVDVTDSGTGGSASWTGVYLVGLLDGTASANDILIKIVGTGVDENSTIAIAGGDVVLTV